MMTAREWLRENPWIWIVLLIVVMLGLGIAMVIVSIVNAPILVK